MIKGLFLITIRDSPLSSLSHREYKICQMRHRSFRTTTYDFINYGEMAQELSQEIWEMRNDPSVSEWMVDSREITMDTHKNFVESLKTRTDKDYYLIRNHAGETIGSVNIYYGEDGVSERGLFINPKLHKLGHAYRTMREFYAKAADDWEVRSIKTRVKVGNAASNSLERKLGARLVGENDGYNVYILELV